VKRRHGEAVTKNKNANRFLRITLYAFTHHAFTHYAQPISGLTPLLPNPQHFTHYALRITHHALRITLSRPKIFLGGAVTVKHQSSRLQEILDTVEALPIEEQAMLVEILRHRLHEYRRSQLIAEVKEARTAYQHGEAHRGTVEDLMRELEE